MKQLTNKCILLSFFLIAGLTSMAQTSTKSETKKSTEMNTYVIEREIPGAGNLTPADLKAISQKSNGVLKDLGQGIQWLHSYVTGNKIYCVYKAENEEIVKEHAKKGGFPANSISKVGTVINPKTAD